MPREEEIGESNSPGVTQDDTHAGKIDDGAGREAAVIKPFHCDQSISVCAGQLGESRCVSKLKVQRK